MISRSWKEASTRPGTGLECGCVLLLFSVMSEKGFKIMLGVEGGLYLCK